jgi:uncharacterized protein (DUF1684 family)
MSFTLLEWRRRVASMYAAVRADTARDPLGTLRRFRAAKDRLLAEHPDSPLPARERAAFGGLDYWEYDPAMRFVVPVEDLPPADAVATSLGGDTFALRRIGRVTLPLGALDVYWLDAYGGGIFLPFRDATSGRETYGAGRYLLDTVKGADLGGDATGLVIDLNYAYHPSCAYDPRWSCPWTPPANVLPVPVRAGERGWAGSAST